MTFDDDDDLPLAHDLTEDWASQLALLAQMANQCAGNQAVHSRLLSGMDIVLDAMSMAVWGPHPSQSVN